MELGDDHDGPEGLLSADEHLIVDVCEDRRLEEESLSWHSPAAHNETRSLLHSLLHELQQLLQVRSAIIAGLYYSELDTVFLNANGLSDLCI